MIKQVVAQGESGLPEARTTSEPSVAQRDSLLPSLQKGGSLQGAATSGSRTAQPLLEKMEPGAVARLVNRGNYTVQATVLETRGAEENLVRIGGKSYQLDGPLQARPGEARLLQLQTLQPEVTFIPVERGGAPLPSGQPLTLVSQGQGQELPALIRALQLPIFTGLDLLPSSQQQLLKDFQTLQPAQLQKPGAGELLKRGLEQLGIRSEAMVAQGRGQETAVQLKTLLAEITKLFQGQEEISASANRLLSTLENSQFLQAGLNNDNIFLFPLPFSFVEKGYLMVESEGDTREERERRRRTFPVPCTLPWRGLEMSGSTVPRMRRQSTFPSFWNLGKKPSSSQVLAKS